MKAIKINKNMLFLGIVLSGIILRVFHLTYQSVWIDEFCTAKFASRDSLFYIFWEIFARDMHPPTFYMLTHFMGSIFGCSEFSLRILPLIFGIVNMFIIYKIARIIFSEKIAMIAVFLFAFNPYQIYYSQEARMYTMFLMSSLMILYYFLMSLKYNTFIMKPFIFWSVLGIYTHSYTVLILLVLNVLVFLRYREEIRFNLWLKAQFIILLFLLPFILFFVKGALGDQYSQGVGMLLAPVYSMKNYLFGFGIEFNVWSILGLIGSSLLIFMAVFTYRHKHKISIDTISITCFSFMLIPWLISVLRKPIYSDRTFILVSALLIILLAIGASYLSKHGLIIFLVIISAFYTVSLYNYYFVEKYQKTHYREQFNEIKKNYKAGDIIVHPNVSSYASFEFYNKHMYKTNFENRYLSEIPEFRGSKLRYKIRDMWRNFKENVLKKRFGFDVYASYDRNTLTNEEAMKELKNYKRVWFINDNKTGIKQVWMPMGNVWNSKYEDIGLNLPADPEKINWVKKYFNIVSEKKYFGSDVILLERK